MTSRPTRCIPHDSRNSNLSATVACVARLDLNGSPSATSRRKMPSHNTGAGGRPLRKVQR
jgi:hypothetical protein